MKGCESRPNRYLQPFFHCYQNILIPIPPGTRYSVRVDANSSQSSATAFLSQTADREYQHLLRTAGYNWARNLIHPVLLQVLLSIHSIVCFSHFLSRWSQIYRGGFQASMSYLFLNYRQRYTPIHSIMHYMAVTK